MAGPDKKALTERDICTKFITPALIGSDDVKWNVMTQLREPRSLTGGLQFHQTAQCTPGPGPSHLCGGLGGDGTDCPRIP